MNFKSQEEMMRALLDGGKICHQSWRAAEFAHILNGVIVNELNEDFTPSLSSHNYYSIYKEPKQTETIKVYGFVDITDGEVYRSNDIKWNEGTDYFKRAPELDREISYEL